MMAIIDIDIRVSHQEDVDGLCIGIFAGEHERCGTLEPYVYVRPMP
jgi:hypothetical protein